jgi:hypothetical protein
MISINKGVRKSFPQRFVHRSVVNAYCLAVEHEGHFDVFSNATVDLEVEVIEMETSDWSRYIALISVAAQ